MKSLEVCTVLAPYDHEEYTRSDYAWGDPDKPFVWQDTWATIARMRSLRNLQVSISPHEPWPGALSIIDYSWKEDRSFGPMMHVQQTERFEVVVDSPASEGFELVEASPFGLRRDVDRVVERRYRYMDWMTYRHPAPTASAAAPAS